MELAAVRRRARAVLAIGAVIMVVGIIVTLLDHHYAGLALIIVGLVVAMVAYTVTHFFNSYDLAHLADRRNPGSDNGPDEKE